MFENKNSENIKLIILKKNNNHNSLSTIKEINNISSNIYFIPKIIEIKSIIFNLSNKFLIIILILFIIYIFYTFLNRLKDKLKHIKYND